MSGRTAILASLLAVLLPAFCAQGHIGDQNVFFEGGAGPYPVRIIIRTPGVIPGLAEISVRALTNSVQSVTVLPMRWDSARKGAPPPDVADRVRGESNLFNAQLWFMRSGAQGVEVSVHGEAGSGKVIVPVNAIATRVLSMTAGFAWTLAITGLVLAALGVSIVGAAVRESVLPSGEMASRRRIWLARAAVGVSTVAGAAVVWFGNKWWAAEANDYRNNRLHKPLESIATIRHENGSNILQLERAVNPRRNNGPLVPEHGKFMHMFLIREPKSDAFAHLHPEKRDWKRFETVLPPLPPGDYQLYADVTYETGFTDTLVAKVTLRDSTTGSWRPIDKNDSWHFGEALNHRGEGLEQWKEIEDGLGVLFSAKAPVLHNREARLEFRVRDGLGKPSPLQNFMGMQGHLIVRRADGAVFTHLHPSGSFSMASQQLFEMRASGLAPLKVGPSKGDPICRLPEFDSQLSEVIKNGDISFPYAFPQPGAYRLWLQIKAKGKVRTASFDLAVEDSTKRETRTRP